MLLANLTQNVKAVAVMRKLVPVAGLLAAAIAGYVGVYRLGRWLDAPMSDRVDTLDAEEADEAKARKSEPDTASA